MGLKNGKAVRKTSLNTEVMEVGSTSIDVLLSSLREGRQVGAVRGPAALLIIWFSFWDQIFSTVNSSTLKKKKFQISCNWTVTLKPVILYFEA